MKKMEARWENQMASEAETIEAASPEEAYEKFINKHGSKNLAVLINHGWYLERVSKFKKHIRESITVEPQTKNKADAMNTLTIELDNGEVVIELFPKDAPKHVERVLKLASEGKYDGVAFHRVIAGFMAQTGDIEFGNKKDYNSEHVGTGGSDLPDLPAEFNSHKHVKGTCSMARAASPNSANSQFFICFEPAPFLDNQYTVWGQVIKGMKFVDNIKVGSPSNNGLVNDPDFIKKVFYSSGNKPILNEHSFLKDVECKIPSISLYDKTLISKKVFESLDRSELGEVVDFLDDKNSLIQAAKDFIQKKKNNFEEALILRIGNDYASGIYDASRNYTVKELMDLSLKRLLKQYGVESSQNSKKGKMDISKKGTWEEFEKRLNRFK